jgi:chaperonin GroEL
MKALEHSKTLLYILSKHSNDSDQVLTELETAKDNKIPIIPIIIEEVNLSYEIKYFIRSHQWIDAQNTAFEDIICEAVNSVKGYLNDENADSKNEVNRGHAAPQKTDTLTDAKMGIFRNPFILVHKSSEKISSLENIPAIDEILSEGRPLIIISNGFEGEAAQFINPDLYKKIVIQALIVPGYGSSQDDILWDISIYTGATFISEDFGFMIEFSDKSSLGEAELVKVNQQLEKTEQDSFGSLSYYYSYPLNMIFNGKGESSSIKERMEQMHRENEMNPSDYDKEKIQVRINNLSTETEFYSFKYIEQ